MRRASLLALVGAGIAVTVLAVGSGDGDRPRSAGAPVTPGRRAAPAGPPADGRCRQIPLPVPPDRLALAGRRLFVASSMARSVGVADVRACRWLGTVVRLPSRATVTPPPPQAGVIQGPDRPRGLAADRHSLWVVGELTLYRFDVATRCLTARVPLPGLALVLSRDVLWAANLAEGPIRVGPCLGRALSRVRDRAYRPTHRPDLGSSDPHRLPTELLASAGGHLWAIPSVGGYLADPQLRTVLEIDARSGRVVRSYHTRGRPRDVVATGNNAWVATTESNELVSFSGSATR